MKKARLVLGVVFVSASLAASSASARYLPPNAELKKTRGPNRVLILDGSTVHNVGELQMHVSNWGQFGSWPGSRYPFSQAPSAQWPAGSGVEYLYVAGLWVGAMKGGVPAVSTAAYEWEFRPTQDERDRMYFASEGDRGGTRPPSPAADDDRDGLVDEDYLNGRDDDEDGLVDEDFAAIGKQMMSCQYRDDQPITMQIHPEHNPLHILVRQESYQWEEDRFDDFVGVEYHITNVGKEVIEDIYIGFFADCDAGPRDKDNYWEDDATGHKALPKCTDLGPVAIDIAYTYDADGDVDSEKPTPGYFGVMFLGYTTDPTGLTAPPKVELSTYANFSGNQSYEEGGDPTNDFERYELLSKHVIEKDDPGPRDFRMLVAAGPFAELDPESTLVFQVAFVCGAGFIGMFRNAANAQLTYNGAWFDMDHDTTTGTDGRETRFYNNTKDIQQVKPDSCADPEMVVNVPPGEVIYVNGDCDQETFFKTYCGYGNSKEQKALYMTGVEGKETQIYWLVGTAPPPPKMRVDPNSADGLVIYWDNFSEAVPDVKTQKFDFEGYRIWRADGWDRPLGSNESSGPAHELWKLLFEADIVNGFGNDTGLDKFRYEPLTHILSPAQKRDYIESIKAYLLEYSKAPPCPQGVSEDVCDTLFALALWDLGLDGGRQYYRYVDKSRHIGVPYFYAVTATDHSFKTDGSLAPGKAGDPSSNFVFVEPGAPSLQPWAYKPENVYVVPNPATKESMNPWSLQPNNDDPTGIKVEFRNLPACRGVIHVYTLAGDLVKDLPFDGTTGSGVVQWDLVSRNGQDITSGIYLYSVWPEDSHFRNYVGKFVVIR